MFLFKHEYTPFLFNSLVINNNRLKMIDATMEIRGIINTNAEIQHQVGEEHHVRSVSYQQEN